MEIHLCMMYMGKFKWKCMTTHWVMYLSYFNSPIDVDSVCDMIWYNCSLARKRNIFCHDETYWYFPRIFWCDTEHHFSKTFFRRVTTRCTRQSCQFQNVQRMMVLCENIEYINIHVPDGSVSQTIS